MPTYTYLCEKCGETYDVWQSIHDKPLLRHIDHDDPNPAQCAGAVRKVIVPPMTNLHQGQSEVISTDTRGSKITKHWDGSQSATVVPKTISVRTEVN